MFSFKDRMMQQHTYNTHVDNIDMTHPHIAQRVDRLFTRTFIRMALILLCAFCSAYALTVFSIAVTQWQYLVAIFGGLGIILFISFMRQRLHYRAIALLLLLFGILEGIGISTILYSYTNVGSIFLVTSVMFAILAVIGNMTNINITRRGTILFSGLIALIVAQLVGMGIAFFTNIQMDTFISIYSLCGVLLFSAFVIYDINVLKSMAMVDDNRIELVMGMSIFLTFINLFHMLLNLFGDR